ncbi:MAG: PdxA family dehydrogenase [Beijerinckiaceae bacterium]
MSKTTRALIGVTMGDPAGIGPEIVAKMLAARDLRDRADAVVIGSAEVMQRTARMLKIDLPVVQVRSVDRVSVRRDAINVYDTGELDVTGVRHGEISETTGEASMLYNRLGAGLAQSDTIDALLTSPVTKISAKRAGYNYAGQAEYFAELAGDVEFVTILIYQKHKAALLTTHLSLLEACKSVKKDLILQQLQFLHDRRAQLGHDRLTIGVAALNPHAGESGTMGREEIDEITPAVEEARRRGIEAEGPFPVNALISPPYDGRGLGMTLAMYHDQVVARMNMHETTTLTFGLPFIRTSVGHGSALDIAGKGVADETAERITMMHTIELAEARLRLAQGRV